MGEVIRRTKNGRFLGYYLRFYEGGRRRIIASKQTSHAEARRMLLEIEARVARGERGIVERPVHSLTVSELANRFLSEYDRPRLKNALKYRAQTKSVIGKALAWLGKLSVDQIKPADVVRMRDAIRRTHAPGTVNSTMDRLSVVFSWGVKQGLAPANPCRGVERTRAEGALDFWSKEDVQRLLDAAEAHQKTLSETMRYVGVALAVHTGLRKGELLGLRWIDVDLEALRLTVARSYVTTPKGGKTRHLRLPSALVPILKEWKERCPPSTGGTILPIGRTETKTANKNTMLGLDTLMNELGLRKVRHPWHMLRHTFASHFVMSGGNILALQKILGHSDLKMTMIYAHLAPDYLGQEMERVSFARTGPHPPKLPITRP